VPAKNRGGGEKGGGGGNISEGGKEGRKKALAKHQKRVCDLKRNRVNSTGAHFGGGLWSRIIHRPKRKGGGSLAREGKC